MTFSKLNLRTDAILTSKMCPKHQTRLRRVSHPVERLICLDCIREAKAEQEERDLLSYLRARNSQVLNRCSFWGDTSLKQATFDSYVVQKGSESELNKHKAINLAQAYKNPQSHFNCVFYGKPGVGKSHLASAILHEVVASANQQCLFININQWLEALKQSYQEHRTLLTSLDKIAQADLVVLDDLGTESAMLTKQNEATQWVQSQLFDILDRRKRTIITTNLDSKKLYETYNPKLMSRLFFGIKQDTANRIITFKQTQDRRQILF